MSDARIVSPRVLIGWTGAAAAIFALSRLHRAHTRPALSLR